MIKHMVMFKLAEKTSGNMEKAISALKSLEGKIEALRALEIGVDFTEGNRSYDIVLTAHFDDREGFATYGPHPHHTPVAETLRALCSSMAVVDSEIC